MHDGENADDLFNLRKRAVWQLTDGGRTQRTGTAEAMAVLLQLASSPDTASDAQALLHELQVHQVELDLQYEELCTSRDELESALTRQACLFERAPAAYLSMDAGTVVREINLAGERLLGVRRGELLGRPLSRLLTEPGSQQLESLVMRAREGLTPQTCELQVLPRDGPERVLLANASRDIVSGRILLVLMEPLSST